MTHLCTLRHAIDFRLMKDRRVAILDASYSLFNPSSLTVPLSNAETDHVSGLKPIPRFKEIVAEVVRDAITAGKVQRGTVAVIDVGVICDTATVNDLGREIHTKVQESASNPESR